MQRVVNNTQRIIDPFFSAQFAQELERLRQGRLHQQVSLRIINNARRESLLSSLGQALTTLAQNAYAWRRTDLIEDASRALLSLPLGRDYNAAGLYFNALSYLRRGDLETGESLLTPLIAGPPHLYSARAMQSLGVLFYRRNDVRSAMELYCEAARLSVYKGTLNSVTALYVQQGIAVIKGANGDHRGAVEFLGRIMPLARIVGSSHPPVFYDILNSLAVELGEAGQLEQARRISETTLAFPFADAYPNWRETRDEIAWKQRRATRSLVAVPKLGTGSEMVGMRRRAARTEGLEVGATEKLVRLPERLPSLRTKPKPDPSSRILARVLNFQAWKEKAAPSSNLNAPSRQERSAMTAGDKLIRLMDLISDDETDDETIDVILEAVEAIVLGKKGVL